MATDKSTLFVLCLLLLNYVDSNEICDAETPAVRAPQCCSGQISSQRLTQRMVNGTCLIDEKQSMETPNCLKKDDEIGDCKKTLNGKFHCLAEDVFYKAEINDKCECTNTAVKRLRICCCKDPERFETCDKDKGIKETVYASYTLVNDSGESSCERHEDKKSTEINFPTETTTKNSTCTPSGLQTSTIIEKYRDGCEIKEKILRTETRPCACKSELITEERCSGDSTLIKDVYKRKLECCECSCICQKTFVSSTSSKIECPGSTTTNGLCTYPNNERGVTTTSYTLTECKCKKIDTVTYEKCPECKYKETRRVVGECCPCRKMQTITTYYKAEGCADKEEVEKHSCACSEEAPKDKTICKYGSSYTKSYTIIYNTSKTLCEKKSTKVLNQIKCPKERIETGKCGEPRQYYIKITTVQYKPDQNTCICQPKEHIEYRICSCPKPKNPDWKCVNQNQLERSNTTYSMSVLKNKCFKSTITETKMVVCHNTKRDNKIRKGLCEFVIVKYFSHVKDCECMDSKTETPYFVCCNKTSTTEECVNENLRIRTKISYKLKSDHSVCERLVSEKRKIMGCKEYIHTSRPRCIRNRLFIIKRYHGVQNCVCVKLKVDKIPINIVCPTKPVVRSRCLGNKYEITRTRWSIERCQCISRTKCVHKPIECSATVDKKDRCDRKTGKITVHRTSYVIENCKCVRKNSIHKICCPCWRPDRIERLKCVGKKRIVIKLRYDEVGGICQWGVIQSEIEDCECCKDISVTDCVKDYLVRTTITSYALVLMKLKLRVQRCVQRTNSKTKPIVCKDSYSYTTSCKDFQQSVVSCKFRAVSCRCTESCKTKCIRACNCNQRNTCAKKCINNKYYKICHLYSDNGRGCGCGCQAKVSQCAESSSKEMIPVSCTQPTRRRWSTGCTFYKNHGYYKKWTKAYMVKENCQCRLIMKSWKELCFCDIDRCPTRPFCRRNKMVFVTTIYYKRGEICIRRDTESEKEIYCPKSFIITNNGPCSVQYKLVYYTNQNCRCVKKISTKSNSKCCIKTTTERHCSGKDWTFTEHRWVQRYSRTKLFAQLSDSPMSSFCEHIKRCWKQSINCDRDSFVKLCNTKTLKRLIYRTYYKIENCACVKKIQTIVIPCRKCPKTIVSFSLCGPRDQNGYRFLQVNTTTFPVMENNKCREIVKSTTEICGCPDPTVRKYCKNGKLVSEKTTLILKSNPPCKPCVTTTEVSILCYNYGKPNRWILGKTEKCQKPGEYTITNYERQHFNKNTCRCTIQRKKVRTQICCKPCRSIPKCIANVHVLETICEHPQGLKCVVTTTSKSSNVDCPCSTEIPVGISVNCTQQYSLTSFKNVNCLCVRTVVTKPGKICCKPRSVTKRSCEGQRWKITTTHFRLKNRQCLTRDTVDYEDLCTCQLNQIEFEDKKIDSCTFWRSYYNKKIVQCKYQPNFIRKEKLNYRCCEPERTVVTCKRNRILVHTRHYFILCHFHCHPKTSRKEKEIDCSNVKLGKRILTGICTVTDITYKVVYNKCTCGRKEVKVEHNVEICCCHKKPYIVKKCDKRRGLITTIHYKYILKDKKCISIEITRNSRKVHCNRKLCRTVVGPCVKDTNVVQLYCMRRLGCRCYSKVVHSGNQCCKPESFEWSVLGKCLKYFEERKYFAFRLTGRERSCKAVVIRIQRKRCRCCRPRVTEACENDIYVRRTTITHSLNREIDSCIRSKVEKLTCIKPCTRRRIRLRRYSRDCDSKTGWGQVVTLYKQAKNCTFINFQTVKRCPCICEVAYPRQERSYCKNNNLMMKETKTAICERCRVRWCLQTKIIPQVNCEKIVKEKGNCFPFKENYAISARYVSTIQYKIINCKCVRKEIKRTLKHCECRKTCRKERCLISKIIITTHNFSRKKGLCQKSSKSVVIAVPCPIQPNVTLTKCEQNKYSIITQTFYHSNCKCLFQTCRKECDCSCPSKTVRKECSGRYFVNVITTTWMKVDCRCRKDVMVRSYSPKCPKYTSLSIGECIKKLNDGYRKITTRKLLIRPDVCKCSVVEDYKYEICWCKENVENTSYCKNDNIMVREKWNRLINRHKNICERVKVFCTTQLIPCLKSVIKYECNRGTMRDVETITSFKVIKCENKKTIEKNHGRCVCTKKWKLVKRGKCSRPRICLRTNNYIKEVLSGRRCIKVNQLKTVKCCCYPAKEVKEYCENNKIHQSTTIYTLVRQKCVPKKTITLIPLNCPTNIIVKKGICDSNGFKIISQYRNVVRKCKCVLEKFREYRCQCKCCKDEVRYTCDRALRIRTRRVTKYSVLHCKCVARVFLSTRLIRCPADSEVISLCTPVRGAGYSIRTFTRTSHHVDERCKCVPKTRVKRKICWCERNENVTSSCNHNTHVTTVRKTFIVLRNCACITEVESRNTATCCGSGKWILKGDSGCIPNCEYGRRLLSYVRQIIVGCGCKEEGKTRECHCMCSGPTHISSCKGNRIEHIYYSYKMVNCKCVRSSRVRWEDVKCKLLAPIIKPCCSFGDGTSRIYKIYRHREVKNCKCRTVTRPTWTMCECRKPYTVRACDKTANMWILTTHSYELRPKECRECLTKKTESIPCDRTPDCRVISRCMGKKKDRQIHECTFRRLINCVCVVEIKKIPRRCRCKRTKKERGRCIRRTCRRTITTTRYLLVVLRNNQTKCVPEVIPKEERCCCRRRPTKTTSCLNNKLLETSISYNFNRTCKTCQKKSTVKNITPDCCPARKKTKGKCDPKCDIKVQITLKSLSLCKCKVTTRSFIRKCCCPKNYIIKDCVGPKKTYANHQFTLIHGRCHEKICFSYKQVVCPLTTVRYVSPCNVGTRTRIQETISYKLHNCKCVKVVVRKDLKCRCRKPYTREICITKTGIIKTTHTSYSFDEMRHECNKCQKINYRKIECDTRRHTRCTKCKVAYKCGSYRKCKTTFGVRTGCTCIYQSISKFKLCECPSSQKVEKCAEHKRKFTEESYYIRELSRSRSHDFECVKKIRYINTQTVVCPTPMISHEPCVNLFKIYTKRYFVHVNCVCIMRSKTFKVQCDCPCQETIRTVCVHHSRQDITVRYHKLVCNKRVIPRCKCVHFDQIQLRFIVCRRSHFIVGKCVDGRRSITVIRHRARNCICEESRNTFWTHCDECQSEIPQCSRIKAMGLCNKDLYLKYLCQFTCEYCERCDQKCVTRHVGQCQCKKLVRMNVCSRETQVIKHEIVNRKCVKRTYVRRSLCDCSMDYSKSECEKLKREGRCREIKIMRKCEFVCNNNCGLCQGSVTERKCVQSGRHKATYRVVVVSFTRDCESCLTNTGVTYEGSCKVCSKRITREVTDCIHDTRFVLTKFVKKERRVCVNKEIRTAYSCRNCCPSTETKIGNCANGTRTVVTVFWAEENNSCKQQTLTNVYSCNTRCSSVSHVRSQCLNNRQIEVKVWHSGRMCWPHRVTEMINCLPVRG